MRLRSAFCLSSALVSALAASLVAQTTPAPRPTQTSVALHPDLLPGTFGRYGVGIEAGAVLPEPSFSLNSANRAALEECSPVRSSVQDYGPGPVRVEAVEFKDASGALAAFSMLAETGMHDVSGVGQRAVEDSRGAIFVEGSAVAVVFPVAGVTVAELRELANRMPVATGSQALQPLLPTLLPTRGLVAGSVRYALGPRSYMAEGGVLPAAGLGWDKDAEAVTARYNDRRGAETLTLLLYPTPTIAGPHLREIEELIPGLGPSFNKAKTRREGSLLALAEGTFSLDAAQALVENTHLHQLATTDKAMPTPELVETRKTFGLLANVIVFSGVLGSAAVLLGLFLGGGRALIRVLRGQPAATEAEFLSLHLAPQNPTPMFSED